VRAQLHASSGPRVEVGCDVHGSTSTLGVTDRPELVEGLGALNGRLVHSLSLGDPVRASVRGDGALVRRTSGRVVCAEVFNDVVFDERVGGPAVDGEVTVAVGVVGTAVVDRPGRSWVPALAADPVATSAPSHGVSAVCLVGVRDVGAAIRPERVVVATVGTGAARGGTDGKVAGCGSDTNDSSRGEDESRE